jgi:hypothetical protein
MEARVRRRMQNTLLLMQYPTVTPCAKEEEMIDPKKGCDEIKKRRRLPPIVDVPFSCLPLADSASYPDIVALLPTACLTRQPFFPNR